MKKLPLYVIRAIFWIFFSAGAALAVIGALQGIWPLLIPGAVLILLAEVLLLLYYRCPYCGKFLGRSTGRFCPNCGRRFPD